MLSTKEILDKCRGLKIVRRRRLTDEYAELVLPSPDILYWRAVFDKIFGEPLSPAGIKPRAEDIAAAKYFGGIGLRDTLYRKESDGKTVIAIFWPWQDQQHTTLKIIIL